MPVTDRETGLTLHATPVSLYAAKVRIALRAKGLAFTEVPPEGGYASAAWRARVPQGTVPALEHGALLIADSEAILEYLEEAFPDPPLLPQGPAARSQVRVRGRFHDTRLEPAVRALFPLLARRETAAAGVDAMTATVNARLASLAALPRLGGALTLGDCGYPPCFAVLDALERALGLPVKWPAAVREEAALLEAMPAVATVMGPYRAAVAGWVSRR